MTRERLEFIRKSFDDRNRSFDTLTAFAYELIQSLDQSLESSAIEATNSPVAKEIERLKGDRLERMAMLIFPIVARAQSEVGQQVYSAPRDVHSECAIETVAHAQALITELDRVQKEKGQS
jgi:hypothetical protein